MKPIQKKNCTICGKEFETNKSMMKMCSTECRNKSSYRALGRVVILGNTRGSGLLPPNTVGSISELAIAQDLLLKGYAVFRSMSPSCYCDLIVVKEGKTIHMEVRTGYRSTVSGKLSFPTKISEYADCYGIWERNSKECFYVKKDTFEVFEM